MLSLYELAVMKNAELYIGTSKQGLVRRAIDILEDDPKFDERVALATVDELVKRQLLMRLEGPAYYLTPVGNEAYQLSVRALQKAVGMLAE